MELYEKHRPKTLAEVAGHDKAKARLARVLAAKDFDRGKFYISGETGIGKTTLADILCRNFISGGAPWQERWHWDIEEIKGVDCDVDEVRRIAHLWQYYGGSGSP